MVCGLVFLLWLWFDKRNSRCFIVFIEKFGIKFYLRFVD